MRVIRLIKVAKSSGMVDVIGLRLICGDTEQNAILNRLVQEERILKEVPYAISVKGLMYIEV